MGQTPKRWDDDLLGYKAVADTFSKIVTSIDDGRVISIEAGFGRGKSFFAERWAAKMVEEGENVITFDAWRAEQADDPLVSFIGALIRQIERKKQAQPKSDPSHWDERRKSALKIGRKVLVSGAKITANAVARGAAEEIGDILKSDEEGVLSDLTKDATDQVGAALSKAAQAMIEEQLAAEKVRQELPAQIKRLRKAITGEEDGRIIVIVDELDRCHPDFALSLLEAMKHVFDQPGYVFCLMINADYLEALAKSRFGLPTKDEPYLDKFIDMRLALPETVEVRKRAAQELADKLPQWKRFNDDEAFDRSRAIAVIGDVVGHYSLSMRQIERVLLSIKIAILIHPNQPMDVALLILMAFEKVINRDKSGSETFTPTLYLPRADFDENKLSAMNDKISAGEDLNSQFSKSFNRSYAPILSPNRKFVPNSVLYNGKADKAAKSYLSTHRAILDGVYQLTVDEDKDSDRD